jgi:hypothetical protein
VRKFNFYRPLFIIIIAYLVNNIATNVSLMFGVNSEVASNIGYMAMLIAAIITFARMNRKKKS